MRRVWSCRVASRESSQDDLREFFRSGELRPVAGRQVDIGDIADLGELADWFEPLLDPLPEHMACELGRDDGDRDVVSSVVGELL